MRKFTVLILITLMAVLMLGLTSCKPKKTPEIRCGQHLKGKRGRRSNQNSLSEFPFLVQVKSYHRNQRVKECTGILIRANMVLTSDLCTGYGDYELSFGDSFWNSRQVKALKGSKEVSTHPFASNHYRCHTGTGLKVLHLAVELDYSLPRGAKHAFKSINGVCLDTDDIDKNNNLIGERVVAVGWAKHQSKMEQAQVFETTVRECWRGHSEGNTLCLDNDRDYIKGGLMEGSVLVRNNGHNEWDLVGICNQGCDRLEFINVRNQLACYQRDMISVFYSYGSSNQTVPS